MSKFKHIRQQKEYNKTLSRRDFFKHELHKLESNQKSNYTMDFLINKINRINNVLYYAAEGSAYEC